MKAGRAGVPFPAGQPPGHEWLPDEPAFDPDIHLALGDLPATRSLEEFGYTAEEVGPTATPVAVSEPFRVLSAEGAEVLLASSRRLRAFARRAGNRIEQTVRGGCYRSRFLRDLCLSPEVAAVMSAIYGIDVGRTAPGRPRGRPRLPRARVGDRPAREHGRPPGGAADRPG